MSRWPRICCTFRNFSRMSICPAGRISWTICPGVPDARGTVPRLDPKSKPCYWENSHKCRAAGMMRRTPKRNYSVCFNEMKTLYNNIYQKSFLYLETKEIQKQHTTMLIILDRRDKEGTHSFLFVEADSFHEHDTSLVFVLLLDEWYVVNKS